MEERLRLLELKNKCASWLITDLRIGARRGKVLQLMQYQVSIMSASIISKRTTAYDVGIRAQPLFGVVMANEYGCEVHAFDPSPIANEVL